MTNQPERQLTPADLQRLNEFLDLGNPDERAAFVHILTQLHGKVPSDNKVDWLMTVPEDADWRDTPEWHAAARQSATEWFTNRYGHAPNDAELADMID